MAAPMMEPARAMEHAVQIFMENAPAEQKSLANAISKGKAKISGLSFSILQYTWEALKLISGEYEICHDVMPIW